MFINYERTVNFSTVIINVGLNEDGLITCGQKTTAGAPAATADRYIAAAIIQNIASGVIYQNTGSSSSPTWTAMATGGGLSSTLASGQIFVGNAGNVATGVAVSGDITISNAGVVAIATGVIVNADINASAAIDFSKLAALPSGDILVGNAGNVAVAVTMFGDVTIDLAGGTTVSGINGFDVDTLGVQNTVQTQTATFVGLGAPQAISGSGAIQLTNYQTKFTSTGTGDALSLADGIINGQIKKVSYVAEGAGADTGVITPVTAIGFTTATLNAIGDYVVLIWLAGLGWSQLESSGATFA